MNEHKASSRVLSAPLADLEALLLHLTQHPRPGFLSCHQERDSGGVFPFECHENYECLFLKLPDNSVVYRNSPGSPGDVLSH